MHDEDNVTDICMYLLEIGCYVMTTSWREAMKSCLDGTSSKVLQWIRYETYEFWVLNFEFWILSFEFDQLM